jgi:glycerol-3-phosphate cytidylyltransferase
MAQIPITKIVGYTTGTYDLPLRKHMELLKAMKARCDYLIVGLVTDELAAQQKRPAYLSYDHRKAILEHCKYVDEVVTHRKESKERAWRRLHFHVLFIGEDYYDSVEYSAFEQLKLPVTVYYLSTPHDTPVHTTHVICAMEQKFLTQIQPYRTGINGTLLRFRTADTDWIIKPVVLGTREVPGLAGAAPNVYQFSVPPPRNWKVSDAVFARVKQTGNQCRRAHINLSGFHNAREIKVHQTLLKPSLYAWNPVWRCSEVQRTDEACAPPCHHTSLPTVYEDGVQAACQERLHPAVTYWLYQNYAGPTLLEYVEQHSHEWAELVAEQWTRLSTPPSWSIFVRAFQQVELVLSDLASLSLVHGDIHPANVCVSEREERVSLIDFGWCQHYSFGLDGEEQRYYEHNLQQGLDRHHWYQSVYVSWSSQAWWPVLLVAAELTPLVHGLRTIPPVSLFFPSTPEAGKDVPSG